MITAPSPRGPDWINAGAYLGVTLAIPVLAVVAALLLDTSAAAPLVADPVERDAIQAVVAWLPAAFWLMVAPFAAWWRWQGRVEAAALQVTADAVTGRTAWPVRRPRSAHLNRLSRVRYQRQFWPQRGLEIVTDDYVSVHDTTGGRIAVKFRHIPARPRLARLGSGPPDVDRYRELRLRLCHVIVSALDRSPHAQANDLTRRRLHGERSTRAVVVGSLMSFLLVLLAITLTLPLTFALLYWLGAFGVVLPAGWLDGVVPGG